MRIGVDFDNTLVCYDGLFHRAAVQVGLMDDLEDVDADRRQSKSAVKRQIISNHGETYWTELQGYVYGVCIAEATPFAGTLDCLAALTAAGHELFIASHKTKVPYRGPKYDLHAAARAWLEKLGPFSRHDIGLSPDNVFEIFA